MDNKMETKSNLEVFTAKALQRLHDKRQALPTQDIYVPSLDAEITIRAMSEAEMADINNVQESAPDNEPNYGDKYMVYTCTTYPDLKALAQKWMSAGELATPMEITSIFSIGEISDISLKIAELSGILDKVQVVGKDDKVDVAAAAAKRGREAIKN